MLMMPYVIPGFYISITDPTETRKYHKLDAKQSYKVMKITFNYLEYTYHKVHLTCMFLLVSHSRLSADCNTYMLIEGHMLQSNSS
jgi:hypothetical protein